MIQFALTFSDGSAVTADSASMAAICEAANARGLTLASCNAIVPTAPASVPNVAMVATDPTICPDGKARAERDASVLAAAGFHVAETVYAVGSKVNSTGVANAKRSRREWEARPTVREACDALAATIATEARSDVDAPARFSDGSPGSGDGLAMGSRSGALRLPDGSVVSVNSQALKGLLSRVGPGGGGADYLAACPTDLRAYAINRHLRDGDGETMTLRTRASVDSDGMPTGSREAFAIVSESYSPFDGDQIASVVADALQGSGLRARADYSRDNSAIRIECLAHSDVAPENYVAGETFKAGITVRSRDDGGGALIVDATFERNLCLNLIILQRGARPIARVTHLSDRALMVATLRRALREAESMIGPFLRRWSVAMAERVHAKARSTDPAIPVRLEDAIPGFYRALLSAPANRLLLPVGSAPEKAIPEIVRAWSREPDDTRASLVNGLTRWAHETVGGTDQDDIAVLAGRVLASDRPLVWTPAPGKGSNAV